MLPLIYLFLSLAFFVIIFFILNISLYNFNPRANHTHCSITLYMLLTIEVVFETMSPEFLLLSSYTNYKSFFRNQKTYFWRKLQSICEYLFSFNEILIFHILQTKNITIKEKQILIYLNFLNSFYTTLKTNINIRVCFVVVLYKKKMLFKNKIKMKRGWLFYKLLTEE